MMIYYSAARKNAQAEGKAQSSRRGSIPSPIFRPDRLPIIWKIIKNSKTCPKQLKNLLKKNGMIVTELPQPILASRHFNTEA
ncbi:MAG: hypothetical protein IJQ33_00325 [Clostridia bacterium]|nr:hypothetical protein [Clostridia bacterium]